MPLTHVVPRLRSTRGRRMLAGAALVVVGLGVSSCSTPAPSQSELSEALVDSGLSRKVADCTASALTDSLTDSELAELTERGAGGAPVDDPEKDGDSYDKLQKAMVACRELQVASQPTTTLAPSEGEGSSTTVSIADGTGGAELTPASSTTTAP